MKAIIRNLSSPGEFLLIIAVCFGLSITASVIWLIHHGHWPALQTHPSFGSPSPNKDVVHLRNDDIVVSAVMELITLGIALWIGRIRGWSLATFGLRVSWKWTGVGVVLFLAEQPVNHLARLLATGSWYVATNPDGTPAFFRESHLTVPFIILIATVNPVCEEAFESGYFFHVLQRYGMWFAVFTTALFRGFLHVTMGLNGFVTMFAMGLLYGFVYWRWRQLWPLIVAHSLQMYYALLPQAFGA